MSKIFIYIKYIEKKNRFECVKPVGQSDKV